jgi:hypothetical protein
MSVERALFTTRQFACESCSHRERVLGWNYDAAPECPEGHGSLTIDHGQHGQSAGVIPDQIPGGVEVKHGICNPDGTPRRYYSKSEMAREAYKRGLTNHVEHVPMRGSDKSPHTTRWI